MTKTLVFPDPGASHHFSRSDLSNRRPAKLHDQAFYHLFWVQNGTIRQHLPTSRRDLREGDLVFVRPGQPHALQGRGEAAIIVSLAIRPDVVEGLAQRHTALNGAGFWSDDPVPLCLHRDIRQLSDLNKAALRLERPRAGRWNSKPSCCPCLPIWSMPRQPCPRTRRPGWDRRFRPRAIHGCSAMAPPVWARAAGKAHPHVARTLRRYLNQTPSEYINDQRMDFAARRLLGTGDSLSEIAADCGIPNLSHFHKLFRAAHGQTPQRFRKSGQKDLMQP